MILQRQANQPRRITIEWDNEQKIARLEKSRIKEKNIDPINCRWNQGRPWIQDVYTYLLNRSRIHDPTTYNLIDSPQQKWPMWKSRMSSRSRKTWVKIALGIGANNLAYGKNVGSGGNKQVDIDVNYHNYKLNNMNSNGNKRLFVFVMSKQTNSRLRHFVSIPNIHLPSGLWVAPPMNSLSGPFCLWGLGNLLLTFRTCHL